MLTWVWLISENPETSEGPRSSAWPPLACSPVPWTKACALLFSGLLAQRGHASVTVTAGPKELSTPSLGGTSRDSRRGWHRSLASQALIFCCFLGHKQSGCPAARVGLLRGSGESHGAS